LEGFSPEYLLTANFGEKDSYRVSLPPLLGSNEGLPPGEPLREGKSLPNSQMNSFKIDGKNGIKILAVSQE
jgi:hypothetical protein